MKTHASHFYFDFFNQSKNVRFLSDFWIFYLFTTWLTEVDLILRKKASVNANAYWFHYTPLCHSATPWWRLSPGRPRYFPVTSSMEGGRGHSLKWGPSAKTESHHGSISVSTLCRIIAGFLLDCVFVSESGSKSVKLNTKLNVIFVFSFIERVLQLSWACSLLLSVVGWLNDGQWVSFIRRFMVSWSQKVPTTVILTWRTVCLMTSLSAGGLTPWPVRFSVSAESPGNCTKPGSMPFSQHISI